MVLKNKCIIFILFYLETKEIMLGVNIYFLYKFNLTKLNKTF